MGTSWSLVLGFLAACSSRGEGIAVEEAAVPIEPVAAREVSNPEAAEPEPGPAPEPAPPAEPVAPAPPELRLVRHDCRGLGISFVDAEVFLHYFDASDIDTIDRMDARGAVAQSWRFTEDLDFGTTTLYDGAVGSIRGRWPDQIYALASYDSRVHVFQAIFRLAGDRWKRVGRPYETVDYGGVWPWVDRSILALTNEVDDDAVSFPRLAVVRGEAKAPWLGAVRRHARCEPHDFEIEDLHVGDDGSLTALVHCGRMWLATWAPGKREATVRKLVPDDPSARLLLGGDGQGFIASDTELVQWHDGALQPVALPEGGPLDEVDRGPDDEPWIRQGNVVSRWTPDGWQRALELPVEPAIWRIHGLDRGTPWLQHQGGTLSMQTTDGKWHPVPLPRTSELDDAPEAWDVYVRSSEDVWVTAMYWRRNEFHGLLNDGRAIYTTRPVPVPAQCGWSPSQSP